MYENKLDYCSSAVTVETYLGIPFLTTKKPGKSHLRGGGGGGRELKILNRDAMKKRTLLII